MLQLHAPPPATAYRQGRQICVPQPKICGTPVQPQWHDLGSCYHPSPRFDSKVFNGQWAAFRQVSKRVDVMLPGSTRPCRGGREDLPHSHHCRG